MVTKLGKKQGMGGPGVISQCVCEWNVGDFGGRVGIYRFYQLKGGCGSTTPVSLRKFPL